ERVGVLDQTVGLAGGDLATVEPLDAPRAGDAARARELDAAGDVHPDEGAVVEDRAERGRRVGGEDARGARLGGRRGRLEGGAGVGGERVPEAGVVESLAEIALDRVEAGPRA